VSLTNTGSVAGTEVVQLYVTLPPGSDTELTHPPLQLKSFTKVHDLQPGETRTVELGLDKYAVSYWEERIARWVVESGEYVIRVGPSSEVFRVSTTLTLEKGFEWSGL
jgi:beta-glucosidase